MNNALRLRSLAAGAVALAAAIAVMLMLMGGQAQAAPDTLEVGAGVGTGTVAGNVYAPGAVTVHVGDTVMWTITSDEPHTITFGANPAGGPPPTWPIAGFTEPPPGPPGPVDLGTATIGSPSAFVNTGVIFGGSTAGVTFTAEGSYAFFCAIHPGMAGTVDVVATTETKTTQAEADAAATATETLILGQVAGLRQQVLDSVTTETRADGTKVWNIFTNGDIPPAPMPGGGTGFLELLEFTPQGLTIGAGDTVHWKATAPHSVTFLKPGQDPHTLGDPFEVPVSKPSQTYDGQSFYNSGLLAFGPPGAPTEFDLTFPNQGTFPYLCLLHGDLGQTGTITVGATTAVSPTPTVTGLPKTGGSPTDGSSSGLSWMLAAIAGGAILATMGGLGLAYRRIAR